MSFIDRITKVLFILILCVPLSTEAAELGGAGVGSGWTLGTSGVDVNAILDEDTMSSDSASALATQQSIKAYVDGQRWTDEPTFSRTDDDTISITATDCTNWQTGTPLRFSSSGAPTTFYYAIVDTCADVGATINVNIFGHPIETDKDDNLEYGVPEVLRSVHLAGVGNCSVSDTWFPKYFWVGQDAYIVVAYLYVDTQATGSALELNIELNGTDSLDTEFSLAVSTSQADSGTTVHETYANALVEQEEFIEISVSQCGSTIPGGNVAWISLMFAVP